MVDKNKLTILSCLVFLIIGIGNVSAVETWTKESGIRVDIGGTYDSYRAYLSDTVILPDGSYRMYYTGNDGSGHIRILSSVSSDGLTWTKESGIRVDYGGTCGPYYEGRVFYPDVIKLPDGTYRMYYQCTDNGPNVYIKSANSSDGLTWVKDPGYRLAPDNYCPGGPDSGQVHGPNVIRLQDGRYRMYYYGSPVGSSAYQIFSAISNDGLNFTKECGVRIDNAGSYQQAVDTPEVIQLPDGTYKMYYTDFDSPEGHITSAISSDGLTWTKEGVIRVDHGGTYDAKTAYSPDLVLLPDGRYRMYYSGDCCGGSEYRVLSAISSVMAPPDSDSDGIPDDADACPTTPGKPEYQGCPVGDENLVELHVIDRNKDPDGPCNGKGSCKLPIEEAEVRVFDRNDADFQALFTKNPKGTEYQNVFETDVGRVGACVTDSNGRCIAGEETAGDYLVIVKYTDIETGKIIYTGKPKSPGDFVDTDGDGFGDLASKDFQVIKVIKKDGSIDFKAGSKTVITGSYLEVIHPDYVIWENNETLYPFIFTSDSDWEVDVCVYVPEGYMVADGECAQAFVTNETKDILFTVVETSSPEPNFKATIKTKRKGKVKKVDIDMPGKRTKKYLERMEKAKKDKKGTPAAAGILGLLGATMTLAIVLQRRK